MFKIDKDGTTLLVTRGDKGSIKVKKKISDGAYEPFYKDDVVSFSLKNNFGDSEPVLRKKVTVQEKTDTVTFEFSKDDTTIGDLISSPVKYQYDIAVNDDLTILGYDDQTGAKYFKLFPEGSNDQ
jgi:hypothetical protein